MHKVAVWLPPQYDEGAGRRRFPVLYDLVGFTGSGLSHTNWKPFGDRYGARILSKRLAAAGIRHTYEEFDDDHSDVDYRMDTSLPFLYRALQP